MGNINTIQCASTVNPVNILFTISCIVSCDNTFKAIPFCNFFSTCQTFNIFLNHPASNQRTHASTHDINTLYLLLLHKVCCIFGDNHRIARYTPTPLSGNCINIFNILLRIIRRWCITIIGGCFGNMKHSHLICGRVVLG